MDVRLIGFHAERLVFTTVYDLFGFYTGRLAVGQRVVALIGFHAEGLDKTNQLVLIYLHLL